MIYPIGLTVDYAPFPCGLDNAKPRLAWQLISDERAQIQSAYQIIVACSRKSIEASQGDMWDTGKVISNQQAVIYTGRALKSACRYFWKVRVWDGKNQPSDWSECAVFDVGLLNDDDWQACWIGNGSVDEPRIEHKEFTTAEQIEKKYGKINVDSRSTLLRYEWTAKEKVKRAMVYVSGLGFYVMYINGRRIGDYVMTPSKTDYRKRVLYDAYDVTSDICVSRNAIGLMLGNGWFNPSKKFWDWRMQWFGSKRAIVHLRIEYENGSTEVITSNEKWKWTYGPIIDSCIYMGETYDANEEIPGWNEPEFDDSDWSPVNVVSPPGGKLCWHGMEPIQVTEIIRPKTMWQSCVDKFIFDMGQNFSGWSRITVQGNKGTVITLRYAENIHSDGTLDTSTNGFALNEDRYILKGKGIEVFEPQFTYHGFRYVEVCGYPGVPTLDSIVGCVVHSGIKQTGQFHCSNGLINHIQSCTIWSQRSNLMGIPTDCPQRAERLGWLGDAHITAQECMLNFDAARFYRKWLADIRAGQAETGDIPHISPRPMIDRGAPTWSSGYPLIVWYAYRHYGDNRFIEDNFESMRRYVDFLGTQAVDYILPRDRYGDWMSLVDGIVRGDPELAPTFFYYYSALIVSRSANVLGLIEQEKEYRKLAEKIRKAYINKFCNKTQSSSAIYGRGTQCETAMTLCLNLHPDEDRDNLISVLKNSITDKCNNHLNTGILGTKYLFDSLMMYEMNDIAWQIVIQTDYPSFGYMVKNRTTLSEKWNQGSSNNHIMFGSISSWFYHALAGIQALPKYAGYEKVRIQPYFPPGCAWAYGSIETVRGRISCFWQKGKNRKLSMNISIPTNTSAEVKIPLTHIADGIVMEGNICIWNKGFAGNVIGVHSGKEENGILNFEIGSGNYRFTFTLANL